MKCPKCQYISFDSGERCRNCGYEFSLTVDASPDLAIQTGDEALGPLADFALEADKGRARPDAVLVPQPRPITGSFDLPLFKERRGGENAPLVPPAVVPRAPLSVRRSNPLPTRAGNRTAIDEPVLDLGVASPFDRAATPTAIEPPVTGDDDLASLAAPVGPRLLAAIVDAVILGSIGVVVLYLTLKVCGLQLTRAAAIPPVPFAAFLLLVAGGYFTLFTAAGGQTIGKMAAGIRVVPMDADHGRVPLGHSVVRATAYLISALPAGLGFVPALLGADKRAIHDRLADTRVVKA